MDSPIVSYNHPEESLWGVTEHLLAAAVDALNAANWQRGGKGQRPKPIRRPGDNTADRTEGKLTFDGDFEEQAMNLDEVAAWAGIDLN